MRRVTNYKICGFEYLKTLINLSFKKRKGNENEKLNKNNNTQS